MSLPTASSIQWDIFHNIIDGQLCASDRQYHGVDPSTGKQLWPAPVATRVDLDNAVTAGKIAFKAFSKLTLESRKGHIRKLKDALLSQVDGMSELLSLETGKPITVSKRECLSLGFFIDYHLSLEIPEERVEDAAKIVTTRYTPLGVVGAICPWNSPILLAIGKILPALLAGNTVIAKPSPYTPYTTLKLVELAQEALPQGVLQALGGNDDLGPMMTTHPGIAKISFTGSIPTGKRILEACAKTLKRVTLELGGNDAAIVLPDVDVQKTAQQLVMGAFVNSGQYCVATKRIYIHQDIYSELLEEMVQATKAMSVGGPKSGAALGPVQNEMQYSKVLNYLQDSAVNGHNIRVDPPPKSEHGFFIHPTIVDNPPNDSRIIQEEQFGPIVPTQPWTEEEEVIARANDSVTGLAACVWSKDVAHAERIARQLEVGSVFVNSFERPTPQAFFSGHKESGIGGEWGPSGILSYCNAQVIHTYK